MSAPEPRHEISSLTRTPGELSFETDIGGEPRRVWIRTPTAVTPPADAALAMCLMPAMRSGGTLELRERVSPRLLRTQREFQAIQCGWSLDWDLDQPPLREVEVVASARAPEMRAKGRVAAFFSGGVDSWSTVLGNPDITDLIFVRGLDLIPGAARHAALGDLVEERLREAAAMLDLPLHVVETNVRELSDPLIRWEACNPCAIVAVALFLEPMFDRVLIAGDTDHRTQVSLGSSHMVNQLWSTEGLEIVDDGGRFGRSQRLRRIVDQPAVQQTLRVCWENPDGAYNCGRCRKCLLTMISLEAIGGREAIATFPAKLDLELLAEFTVPSLISLVLWEDVLETTRVTGRADLEGAVEPLVVRGRHHLGLPASYRSRGSAAGLATGLKEAQLQLERSELEAAEARARLSAVLNSRSWRWSAPLRWLGQQLRRAR
jgi:hypothetical protein